jgi:hypothetical protein
MTSRVRGSLSVVVVIVVVRRVRSSQTEEAGDQGEHGGCSLYGQSQAVSIIYMCLRCLLFILMVVCILGYTYFLYLYSHLFGYFDVSWCAAAKWMTLWRMTILPRTPQSRNNSSSRAGLKVCRPPLHLQTMSTFMTSYCRLIRLDRGVLFVVLRSSINICSSWVSL